MKRSRSILIIILLLASLFAGILPFHISEPVKAAWWDANYKYYIPITIEGDYITSELANFPVLVVINSTIGSLCDNGNSIRFVGTDNTTTYAYEIDTWNSSANSYVWVNLSTITAGTDTTFLMYYNYSSATDGQNQYGTWNSNYVAVYHMNDITNASFKDSTSYKHNMTKGAANQPLLNLTGIGYSQTYSPTTTGPWNSSSPSEASLSITNLTIDIKFMTQQQNATNQHMVLKALNGTTICNYDMVINATTGKMAFRHLASGFWQSTGSLSAAITNVWYYMTATAYQASATNLSTILYINGTSEKVKNVNTSLTTSATYLRIGGYSRYGQPPEEGFNGNMDEVRISNIPRNASWVSATYHTQNQTTGFTTYGVEQSGNLPPIQSNPIPANNTINYPKSSDCLYFNLSIDVSDPEGQLMDIVSYWDQAGDNTFTNKTNGTYICYSGYICPGDYNTTYTWYVNVTDGTFWVNNSYNFTTIANIAPVVSLPVPYDAGTEVSILTQNLSVLIMDNESDLFYAEINCSNGDKWSAEDLADGFYALNLTNPLQQNTTYTWWVNVTDGYSGGWTNETYMFTTENVTFNISNPSITNLSVEIPLTLANWSIDINSSVGIFNYTIELNHYNNSLSENNATNGTKILSLYELNSTLLNVSDTITIFVNVSYYGATSNWWFTFNTTTYFIDFTFVVVNRTVNFTSIALGNISYYVWSFGDGQYGYLPNLVHTYQTGPANYTATLTVYDYGINYSKNVTKTIPILFNTSTDHPIGQPLLSLDWSFILYLAFALAWIIVIVLIVRNIAHIKKWFK